MFFFFFFLLHSPTYFISKPSPKSVIVYDILHRGTFACRICSHSTRHLFKSIKSCDRKPETKLCPVLCPRLCRTESLPRSFTRTRGQGEKTEGTCWTAEWFVYKFNSDGFTVVALILHGGCAGLGNGGQKIHYGLPRDWGGDEKKQPHAGAVKDFARVCHTLILWYAFAWTFLYNVNVL